MKVNWNYIKAFALFALVIFLYSFSARRNQARGVEKVSVNFTNGENLYVTETAVNKLLIVNEDSLTNVNKEILDLNKLEQTLNQHDMIANADVYLTVNRELGAVVTQKQPIARVHASPSFYIDKRGKKMPLSPNYSARVPWVIGINEEEDVQKLYPLLKKIETDSFMQKHVTAIFQDKKGNYKLGLRKLDFEVLFGEVSAVDAKVSNFKAFYKKAFAEKNLDKYRSVSLEFKNQVVCTKK